jgi:hypothetical protein
MWNFLVTNFTNVREDFIQWSLQGYTTALGFLFWPIVFSTLIGYVYIKQRSATAAIAAILIVFALFGNALIGVGPWVTLLYIFVSLGFTALLLVFIIRRRGES